MRSYLVDVNILNKSLFLATVTSFALNACTPKEDPLIQDMYLGGSDFMVADMDIIDANMVVTPCQSIEECVKDECLEESICQPCEEGGNCTYSGTLRVFGRATSIQNQAISDLYIKGTCGDQEIIVNPSEAGDYELELEVNNCDRLVVIAQREERTEGYVPIIFRYNMPPPVNAINLDLKLIPGAEIRCDGISCEAPGVFGGFDDGSFYTGYAYNSSELNDVSNFGSIFESASGELLWLHRFIYRDLRDDQSQTINELQINGETAVYYGLSFLTYETRAWVADLFDDYFAFDYHEEIYASADWERFSAYLTDPNIDPDNDGQYETIDMAAFKLNFDGGVWDPLTLNGEPLVSHIFAEIETGYFRGDTQIPSGIYSPSRHYVKVPNIYLRGVQTTGDYGPAVDDGIDESGRLNTRGLYRRDYTGIPYYGSGVYAVGQPIPKTCWMVNVVDNCGNPVFGSQISVTGVNHGYHYNEISDFNGRACVEVGRSESNGLDFDGDGLSNERFDVKIRAKKPLGDRRLTAASDRIESTPSIEGDCNTPSSCEEITFTFQNCQN